MRESFFRYQAQTSSHPLALEISRASGSYIYDTNGKEYLDFIAGVSACTLGHCHPTIIRAVQEQLAQYMHVMVYGEFIQKPAVELAQRLAELLPHPLESTYLVNSGTEAIEGALKLARRATGRSEIIYAHDAYHGNTIGSLSIMGFEKRKKPFEPLLPNCTPIHFNSKADLNRITRHTAAVVLETIQGGAGFIMPEAEYLEAVRKQCDATGALLILDEIQPGFGRTGNLFAFLQYHIVPDILVMGKGMGGGLPIGAFTASHELMSLLSHQPELGHITTFGGNPVIAAAALATLREITTSGILATIQEKEKLFRKYLLHPCIKEIRGQGLMLALMFETPEIASRVIQVCLKKGLLVFGLLFEPKAVRITPPLTISEVEIREGCDILTQVLDEITHQS